MKPRSKTWKHTLGSGLGIIEEWAASGLLEKEMAKRIGVRPSTFSEWKHNHAELAEVLKKGRECFIAAGMDNLEVAAVTRAVGYMVTESETITEEGPRGQITKTKTTLRHIPADPTLVIWLLSTHRGETYQRLPSPKASVEGEEQLKRLAGMLENAGSTKSTPEGPDAV